MRANFDQCILKVEQNFELKNLAGKLGSKTLLAPKINCKLKFESFTANYRKGGGGIENGNYGMISLGQTMFRFFLY